MKPSDGQSSISIKIRFPVGIPWPSEREEYDEIEQELTDLLTAWGASRGMRFTPRMSFLGTTAVPHYEYILTAPNGEAMRFPSSISKVAIRENIAQAAGELLLTAPVLDKIVEWSGSTKPQVVEGWRIETARTEPGSAGGQD